MNEDTYIESEWFPNSTENSDEISAYKTFNLIIKGQQFELTEDEVETLIQELQNAVSRNKPEEEKPEIDIETLFEGVIKTAKEARHNQDKAKDIWQDFPTNIPEFWCGGRG
jgi:predicted FMN-binding regulatory protein PaiB